MSIYKLYLTKAYRKFHFDYPKDKNLSKLYNKIYQIKRAFWFGILNFGKL